MLDAPYRSIPTAELTAYRPFVDGLRAVSILAVVLYHVGVPGVSGGYVGVDVFFVISGFLIISQIVEGLKRGSFAFGEFWSRRALRILPPYLLVLAFCMAIAPFVLVMPDQFKQFGKEVGHAAAMVINHLFLIQEGYFDTAADGKVLLHLWTLAVEEQFYLAAPLLIAALWWLPGAMHRPKLHPRLLGWATLCIFALSLGGCILFTGTGGGRNYAFYLSPLRAWEFVAGGAVGFLLPMASRLPLRANAALAAVGLSAILLAVTSYTDETPYPSWRAALPVFGAAAVILGGLASPKSITVSLLSTRPMVWIGLVSYAWYLWHWPLLVFARLLQFGERNIAVDAAVGLFSLGLAAATFIFMERPIRRWRQESCKPLGWQPAIVGVVTCAAIAVAGLLSFDSAGKRLAQALPGKYLPQPIARVPICDLRLQSPQQCLAVAAGRPLGLLIGDSHAAHALWGFAADAEAKGAAVAALVSPGCPPLFGVEPLIGDDRAGCSKVRDEARPMLADGEIPADYALLFARWAIYVEGDDNYEIGPPDAKEPAADQAALFTTALRKTILDLQALGVRRILVLGPTPLFTRPAPNCLYLADRYDMDRAETCGIARATAEAQLRPATEHLAAALAGLPDIRIVDPLAAFCVADTCLPHAGDTILFEDTNHLTDAGIARLIAHRRPDFDWLLGAAQ